MKKLIPLFAAFLLAACGTVIRSDVSTFHSMSGPEGKSFAITPMNPEKADSIEFARYGAEIVRELVRYGYRPVAEGEDPEVIVGFDVVQSDGREKIYSRPSISHFGAWHRHFHYYGYWRAFYGPGYYDYYSRELDARTVYPTTLFVEIRKPEGENIFEGRATTDARNRALARTIPLLAQTLFADFPGPSGETRQVKLKFDEDGNLTSESIGPVKTARSNY